MKQLELNFLVDAETKPLVRIINDPKQSVIPSDIDFDVLQKFNYLTLLHKHAVRAAESLKMELFLQATPVNMNQSELDDQVLSLSRSHDVIITPLNDWRILLSL